MHDQSDIVDLRQVGSILRTRRRWILIGTVLGLAIAALVSVLMRPRYEAEATVLLQSSDPLSSLPGLGDFGGVAAVLGGADPVFETELQILSSRSVLEAVVDSLLLQVQVRTPEGVPAGDIVATISTPSGFDKEKVTAVRDGERIRLSGRGGQAEAIPGSPVRLPSGAELTLRSGSLPAEFELQIVSRQAAVTALGKRLKVEEPGGEVVRIAYVAPDPETAAAVPNSVVAHYLTRRKGRDRGVNQRRYDFLVERTDSIRLELAAAEAALRTFQEGSGILHPELNGRIDVERAMELETEYETLGVEARTLREILDAGASGSLPVRALAAYPTFLRNAAINSLLERLLSAETERLQLIEAEFRTERDPEVAALGETIEQMEEQLLSLSTSYLAGVERQAAQVGAELQRQRAIVATLPRSSEESYRLERDVRLLSEMLAALQAQQLQARLGTISEGGDVQLLDPALPPDEPSSPSLPLNVVIGGFGGFVLGALMALMTGYLGNRTENEIDVELTTGVPTVALREGVPLILGGAHLGGGILVLPVGEACGVTTVARKLADSVALRGARTALLDLRGRGAVVSAPGSSRGSDPDAPGNPSVRDLDASDPAAVRDGFARVEEDFEVVVGALPAIDTPTTTALLDSSRVAVLVVPARRASRSELRRTAEVLRALDVRIIGAVLTYDASA